MNLPPRYEAVLRPLFDALPLEEAMPELIPVRPHPVAEKVRLELSGIPSELAALVWLYVDELEKSHALSQSIHSELGSFLHGVMHRREGDFSNARYWFAQAGALSDRLGLDPVTLTLEAARAYRQNPVELVQRQRQEWQVLFEHCLVSDER